MWGAQECQETGQQDGQEDKRKSLRLALRGTVLRCRLPEHCGNQNCSLLPPSLLPASICSILVLGSTYRWDQRGWLRNTAVAQQLPVPRGGQRKQSAPVSRTGLLGTAGGAPTLTFSGLPLLSLNIISRFKPPNLPFQKRKKPLCRVR